MIPLKEVEQTSFGLRSTRLPAGFHIVHWYISPTRRSLRNDAAPKHTINPFCTTATYNIDRTSVFVIDHLPPCIVVSALTHVPNPYSPSLTSRIYRKDQIAGQPACFVRRYLRIGVRSAHQRCHGLVRPPEPSERRLRPSRSLRIHRGCRSADERMLGRRGAVPGLPVRLRLRTPAGRTPAVARRGRRERVGGYPRKSLSSRPR